MTCDSARLFLNAHIDNELDANSMIIMEEHLRTCDPCLQHRARLDALRSVIAAQAPGYKAPHELRRRIQASLHNTTPVAVLPENTKMHWRWPAIAAAILLTVLAGWQMLSHSRQEQTNLIAEEIVSSHVRSLMADHLVDKPSSDNHTVKPWFAGKLDFSPQVTNLDAQGFPMVGGRLDYIGGHSVAALVYRRRQHVINVFAWPTPQLEVPGLRLTTLNGFNNLRWQASGLSYWAVSDLNSQELEQFSQLYLKQ